MDSWYWLNENSRGFLARGYLGRTDSEERIRVIAETAEKYLGRKGFADKFYEYMGKGWISLVSPVWSNFGSTKGLPISCFGSYVADNMGSILYTNAEVGMMSKFGGGCSGYMGHFVVVVLVFLIMVSLRARSTLCSCLKLWLMWSVRGQYDGAFFTLSTCGASRHYGIFGYWY